jgi:dipeptidyl aminopeptidase/acylaminoacyl peptidase
VFWVDPTLKGLAAGLQTALDIKTKAVPWTDQVSGVKTTVRIGEGADFDIIDWSNDRSRVLVSKSGYKTPPEYYMLSGGKLTLLGRSMPNVDRQALGDATLVQYPARDGMSIPGLLYTPNKTVWGPGPYPAIIHPHGGPWSRDELDWDISGWTQYFVARGYAVLQPQFRGSEGWGQKLWLAGDGEWGQKMQDDMDDGAKWLVAQKIAAPERLAMHGYSYGGYSAFAAAVRPDTPYQCAIAGAGVAELGSFQRETREQKFQREFQGVTIAGLDPLSRASAARIPVLVYHGDRDQTVPVKQSRMFTDRLRSAGKPFKYLEIRDMGHSYATWAPGDAATVLTAIESYLRTDCGPGGL